MARAWSRLYNHSVKVCNKMFVSCPDAHYWPDSWTYPSGLISPKCLFSKELFSDKCHKPSPLPQCPQTLANGCLAKEDKIHIMVQFVLHGFLVIPILAYLFPLALSYFPYTLSSVRTIPNTSLGNNFNPRLYFWELSPKP